MVQPPSLPTAAADAAEGVRGARIRWAFWLWRLLAAAVLSLALGWLLLKLAATASASSARRRKRTCSSSPTVI